MRRPSLCLVRHPLSRALWFAAKGYSVLPLHSVTEAGGCTCGNSDCESVGKHPFAPLAPHGLKDATVDLGSHPRLVRPSTIGSATASSPTSCS